MSADNLPEDNQVEATAPSNENVRAMVRQVRLIEIWGPRAIMAVLCGLPFLSGLIQGSIGSALWNGAGGLLTAIFVIWIVKRVLIQPMKSLRYKRAASILQHQVENSGPSLQWRRWWIGAPGALGIMPNGSLVITDYSTGYNQLRLFPENFVSVSVERQATFITNTQHGGRITFGTGNGAFGAYTTGGRSRSVTTKVEQAFLEIRYQLERNGRTFTTIVPFGGDRHGAEEMCGTLVKLEHVA